MINNKCFTKGTRNITKPEQCGMQNVTRFMKRDKSNGSNIECVSSDSRKYALIIYYAGKDCKADHQNN